MALVVPLKSGPKTGYVRDVNKPNSEKSILELFFDAQYDIENGVQPGIIVQSGYLIENLGPRVRAPTTWETLQDNINQNTEVHKRAEQIENGDFSDDEEEDDELSAVPPSPNSSKGPAQTPPPPSPEHEPRSNQSFSSMSNSTAPYNQNIAKISVASAGSNTSAVTNASNSSSNSVHSPTAFSKPQPRGRPGGRARGKRRGKVSLDDPEATVNTPTSPHNKYSPSPIAEDTPINSSNNNTPINNNNNNNNNNVPNGVASIATVTDNNGGNSSPRTGNGGRRASGGLNTRQSAGIGDMWFEAQAQLSEGRQPRICRKHGIQLANVRIHVQKYANHAKRSSRVSPNDFLGVYISKPRKSIAADDDEDDTDNELSTSKEYSKSQGPDNVPLIKSASSETK